MQVTIHGPNLNDQSKGSFHVHSADCADNDREVKQNGSVRPVTIEALSVEDVVRSVYGDQIREGASVESCEADFYFEPCCSGIGANGSGPAVPDDVATATCRFCSVEQLVDDKHFYRRSVARGGGFYTNGRCKGCERELRKGYREKKGTETAPADPRPPVALTLPSAVTRTKIPVSSTKTAYRYDAIFADGSTRTLVERSSKLYEAASAYAEVQDDYGVEIAPVGPLVFLHSRADLAAKGSPDANLIVKAGRFVRIPGVVAVIEQA